MVEILCFIPSLFPPLSAKFSEEISAEYIFANIPAESFAEISARFSAKIYGFSCPFLFPRREQKRTRESRDNKRMVNHSSFLPKQRLKFQPFFPQKMVGRFRSFAQWHFHFGTSRARASTVSTRDSFGIVRKKIRGFASCRLQDVFLKVGFNRGVFWLVLVVLRSNISNASSLYRLNISWAGSLI